MGEWYHDRANVPELAEAKARDALRGRDHHLEADRWPEPGRVLRLLAAAALAIMVAGWLLTAFNA